MIILDTNVLSELVRQPPQPRVLNWLDRQPRTSIWITSVTIFELRHCVKIPHPGKRTSILFEALDRILDQKIAGRVASFDSAGALQAGELMALRQKNGRPADLRDTMIAGIVLATRATFATRNTSHFQDLDVSVVNPWIA